MIHPANQTRAHASEPPGPALVQDTKRALNGTRRQRLCPVLSAQGLGHSCWALRLIWPSITAQHDIFSGWHIQVGIWQVHGQFAPKARTNIWTFGLLSFLRKLYTHTNFREKRTQRLIACIMHAHVSNCSQINQLWMSTSRGRLTFTIHTWGMG
jgi:hypothetical protein